LRLLFITATPLNIVEGSGTFAGIHVLARSLEHLGVSIDFATPGSRIRNYTLRRLWFNESLRHRHTLAYQPVAELRQAECLPHWCLQTLEPQRWRRRFRLRASTLATSATGCYDAIVGFDMDGYRLASRGGIPHIASIKGIIADEMRFERGPTRWSMALQAACEARHVRRADAVMTTSGYAAQRLRELYGIDAPIAIVPELIDLAGWRELFRANAATPDPARFTVLTVCRFYPRKRLHLLLEAAHSLRERVRGIEFRIVGGGPEHANLMRFWRERRLEDTVTWLGDLSQAALAAEYKRCHVFCLPSVQEGFGIVFLEAMAAGKPIVAARAAAVPEVVPQGLLVEPESAEAIAAALVQLHSDPALRASLADEGRAIVERFDAPHVARAFLDELERFARAHA
jgi:glycosyltransferase involved in cell wall biosynthesis